MKKTNGQMDGRVIRVIRVGKRVLRLEKGVLRVTTNGQESTVSDQTRFASTTSGKMGSLIIITLN